MCLTSRVVAQPLRGHLRQPFVRAQPVLVWTPRRQITGIDKGLAQDSCAALCGATLYLITLAKTPAIFEMLGLRVQQKALEFWLDCVWK